MVAQKVVRALAAGLKVIFCIGESLEEREKGETDQIVQRQLTAVVNALKETPSSWEKMVIAYEPVWAIGTGKVATPAQVTRFIFFYSCFFFLF